jgi:hypothetical protein
MLISMNTALKIIAIMLIMATFPQFGIKTWQYWTLLIGLSLLAN